MARAKTKEEACRILGRRLRELREAKGLSLKEAAERASNSAHLQAKTNLDLTYWHRIETGEVNATLWTLLRVANALDVDLVDLVSPFTRAGQGSSSR